MSDSQQPNLQRLLELHYDLLPDNEAVELRAEIERDGELSRAFENARRTADLFSLAAKLEEPRLSFVTAALDRDGQASPSRVIVNATLATPGSADDGALHFRRAMQWVVGLAAAVLLAFLVGAYIHHRGRLSNIAAEHLRMTVTGPSELARGVENRFEVKTTDITGRPASVPVRYSLFGLAGEKIFTEEQTTNTNGLLMFTFPASTPLPPAARLEVAAITDSHTWSAETALPVELPRLATRLATDKPLYRPGEVVRYRSLTLGRFGLDTPGDVPIHFHVLDPAGATIDGSQIDGITTRGVGNGEFAITPDRPGGEYQLVATCPSNAFPEEKRKFFVRDYRVPRLKKDLEFVRDSYAAGDKVAADLSVIRAEGGPAASAKVTVTAQVDGATVHQQELAASASGACRVEFDLPKAIDRGDGLLSIVVDDGGTQETIAKTIPLNVGKVDIKFYPEGGDLVAGLENRVYFVARNPQGKPQHIVGKVCDTNEQTVVTFETEHDGMGSFAFTPKEQVQYAVKLTKPADVTLTGELPAVNAERQFVLSTGDGVFDPEKPIDLTLQAKKADAPLVVAAYCRGVQVGQASVTTKQGANDVTVPLNAEACGVVRVTVYDYTAVEKAPVAAGASGVDAKPKTDNTAPRPIAERLVYRKLDRRLQVRLADHREHYAPGDQVNLSIMCTNESGEPVKSSVLGVAVVDDSLLKLADDDTASLTTHVLLTTEIEKPEDLEKADFYLSDDPKADTALDLLLGTQGWRRFVERTVEEQRKEGEKAGTPVEPQEPVKRLLALSGSATPPAMLDNLDEVRRRYNAAVTDAEDDQRAALGMLRRIGIGGGIALVLVILALELAPLLRRQPVADWWRAGLRAAPALATAGACLAIAALVFRAGDAPQSSLVAMQQVRIPPPTREEMLALKVTRGGVSTTPVEFSDNLYADWGRSNFNSVQGLGLNRWGTARNEWFDLAIVDPANVNGAQVEAFFKLGGANDRQLAHYYAVPNDAWMYRGFAADQRLLAGRDFGNARYIVLGEEVKFQHGLGFGLQAGVDFAYIEPELLKQRLGRMHTKVVNGQLRYDFDGDYIAPIDGTFQKARLWEANSEEYASLAKSYKVQLQAQLESLRLPIREYAHKHVTGQPGVRSDFTETVCWHPLLMTDDDGRAKLSFELSDSITSFRVLADAHDGAGRIGSGGGEILCRLPFTVEPKLPLEVNAGDSLELPVAVNNDSPSPLAVQLAFTVQGRDESRTLGEQEKAATNNQQDKPLFEIIGAAEQTLNLPPGDRQRQYFSCNVVGHRGDAAIEVRGTAGALADAKRQTIRVVPPGFPIAESYSGRLKGQQEVTIKLPADCVPGSLEVTLAAYPTTLATLQGGMDSMLREPSGCFEQASSSNYPNVLSLQYLKEHNVGNPEMTRRGKELLSAGYAKLTGYECKQRGFEWWGADPGHEALTAYGLLQFRDMAEVHDIDPELVTRSRDWLLARRDGKGSFQKSSKALDSFGSAPQHIADAYIVWALSEAGETGIDAELKQVTELAQKSDDAYVVALAAASAINSKQETAGRKLLDKLVQIQAADGHLDGKEGSITRSSGQSLAVETTALAALAWLKLPDYHARANKAIDWIVKSRSGGGFGTTQATILALKALVVHSKANRVTLTAGDLVVKRGRDVIATQPFAADATQAITLGDFEGQLTTGENRLTISLTGENEMPYSIDISYRARTPNSHADCPVRLTTDLSRADAKAGETVSLATKLTNTTDAGQPMTVAILGLPAGLQPRPDQLDELKKAGTIDYYETRAREVILYWRDLEPKQEIPVRLDLVAEWPGKYTAPASRAYLYYTPEQKQWVEPLRIAIAR